MLNFIDYFPENETTFAISGPAGILEAHTTISSDLTTNITAIICHPHPLMGGTMNNKVVTTVARTFKEMGLRSVRFNFRGVGGSEGVFAEGEGETEDLLAVIDWVQRHRPTDLIWLAGFSFGSYIAYRAATLRPIAQLVSIAPPVHYAGFHSLPQPTCPWLVVQGDEDEVVSATEVYAWIAKMVNPPDLIRLPQAGHFFHGRLIELRDLLKAHLVGRLS